MEISSTGQDSTTRDSTAQDSATQDSATRDWVPETCTLPAARLPARLAEFTRLFADFVEAADRVRPDWLQLELTPTTAAATRAAELAVAESACCSFFSFTLRIKAGRLVLDVEVPESQVAALDGVAAHAAAARQGEG